MLKLKVLFLFLCLVLGASAPALADQPIDPEAIKEFIASAHENLEGEESKPKNLKEFARHWRDKFNLKKVLLSALRWSNVQLEDEKFRDHALNLALILPASHTIEMTAGPTLFYMAHEAGASAVAQSLIAAGGALITLPGLDPLCLVLIASYRFEPVQKTFTVTRMTIYRTTSFVIEKTQLKALMQAFFKKESRLDNILAQQPAELVSFTDKNIAISFAPEGESLLTVDVNNENQAQPYVSRITVKRPLTKTERLEFKAWLKLFGYNARSALMDVVSEQKISGFHIDHIGASEASYSVQFKPQSLPLRPRLKLKCSDWLS